MAPYFSTNLELTDRLLEFPPFGAGADDGRREVQPKKQNTKLGKNMKEQKLFRKGLLVGSAFAFLLSAAQQTNAGTGNDHGFFWSLFVSGGSASISFPNAGQFAGNYA